jgi:hypothetical protein
VLGADEHRHTRVQKEPLGSKFLVLRDERRRSNVANCSNFMNYLVDEDYELCERDREAREAHVRICEDCAMLLEGYLAHVAYMRSVRNGAPRQTPSPRVREMVVRAANAAIDRRQEEARRAKVVAPKRIRPRLLALASAGTLAVVGSLAVRPDLVALTGEVAGVPRHRPDGVLGPPTGGPPTPADRETVAPVPSTAKSAPDK